MKTETERDSEKKAKPFGLCASPPLIIVIIYFRMEAFCCVYVIGFDGEHRNQERKARPT